MSESKKEKDILKALDEMEQVSAEINSRKARVEVRIKKYAKPVKEVSRQEKLKASAEDRLQDHTWAFKTKLTLWLIFGISMELFFYFVLAKTDLVNFVFYNIAALCLYGMVGAKLK